MFALPLGFSKLWTPFCLVFKAKLKKTKNREPASVKSVQSPSEVNLRARLLQVSPAGFLLVSLPSPSRRPRRLNGCPRLISEAGGLAAHEFEALTWTNPTKPKQANPNQPTKPKKTNQPNQRKQKEKKQIPFQPPASNPCQRPGLELAQHRTAGVMPACKTAASRACWPDTKRSARKGEQPIGLGNPGRLGSPVDEEISVTGPLKSRSLVVNSNNATSGSPEEWEFQGRLEKGTPCGRVDFKGTSAKQPKKTCHLKGGSLTQTYIYIYTCMCI